MKYRRVQTTIHPNVLDAVDEMIETGLFGQTRAAVIRDAINKYARDTSEILETVRRLRKRRRR